MRLLISVLALVSFMGVAVAQEEGSPAPTGMQDSGDRAPAKKHSKKGGKKSKKHKKHKNT